MGKIKVIIIILLLLLILGGIGAFFVIKENDRLIIDYTGADKYVDAVVEPEDFTVIDKKTNQKIDTKNIRVSSDPLKMDGTKIYVSCIIDNREYKGDIIVYPTLVIKEIKAKLIPENKHIGSKIEAKDFEVIGINNKDEEIEIENFGISHSKLDKADNDVRITYTSSVGDVSTTLNIKVDENYVVGADAKYIGETLYAGEKVDPNNFEVYYVWHDDTKTKADRFEILDTTLKQAETYLRIFVVDEAGKEYYTDIPVKAKNYMVAIDTIAYIGKPQTIGNTVTSRDFEIKARYYDGTTAKIDNFTIDSGQVLNEEINTIQFSVKNELGKVLSARATVKADYNIIYIGDSRISQLKKFTKSEEYMKQNHNSVEKIYYISSNKADLKWLKNTGIKEVNTILKKNPYTKYKIVINLGLYDFTNVNEYNKYYQTLAKDTFKDHTVYFCSLNPVDETKMEKKKKYSRNQINSVKITEFNDKMYEYINQARIDNLKYLNTNGELVNNSFTTIDGVNYTQETMMVFHNVVKLLTKQ